MTRLSLFLATSALCLAPALVPVSAAASSRGFDTTIERPVQTPVKIEVVLSESLQHRADNLPKSLRKRGGAGVRSIRSGFSSNGFYGQKDLDILLEDVREELTEDFAKRGISVSEDASVTFRVTLEDVKNNRPTFEQMSREPGLSLDSFGIGGAELSGELIGATGESLGTVDYRWYESALDNFAFARATGVWTDARRAISRFSSRTAKTLS
ncbi:MAG: hypothetical protein WBG08_08320 [Litorimonas sp.]